MKYTFLLVLALAILTGCYNDFLGEKRDMRKVIPQTLSDYQALLDNSVDLNYASALQLGMMSSDEYVVNDQQWNLITSATERNAYIWNSEIFEGEESNDWNTAYKRVLTANIVLEGLQKIKNSSETDQWNNINGIALFHRSLAFFELAQQFCDVYVEGETIHFPGIPVRLESDVNVKTPRATIGQTYNQIEKDLLEASEILNDHQIVKERPSKQAAFALLSRVYLQMGKYEVALHYAVKAIDMGGHLLDYTSMDTTLSFSFPARGVENQEVIYMARIANPIILSTRTFNASPDFLRQYSSNDSRRSLYFRVTTNGQVLFKGSYFGGTSFFTGLAIDEMYLIAAECYIRLGQFTEGGRLLHKFRNKRYRNYEELPLSGDVLKEILEERKKQLFVRGLRWSDLKRLNRQSLSEETISRSVNGKRHELFPGDKRYILPLPDNAIKLGNLEENLR